MSGPSIAYVCPGCEWPHRTVDAAENCCKPMITTGWQCEQCNAVYRSIKDAVKCCAETDSEPVNAVPEEATT